tara:strand:- start:27802 stop:28680 length:879 start_codon:yes stop_codon:yes gene_type:complete
MLTTPRILMTLALLTPMATGQTPAPTQDATPKKGVVQDDGKSRPKGELKKGATTPDGKPVKGDSARRIGADGKPVKGEVTQKGEAKPKAKSDAKPDDELLNALDLEALLNKSQSDMAAELRKQLEQGAKAKDKARKVREAKSKESSSSTKRKVVVNGETVVDEETRDGKPVKGAKDQQPAKAPAKAKNKSSDSSSSSSSQIRRIVVVNGKTIVDELIVDGDVGSLDLDKLLKDIDLDGLLKGIDLPADVKGQVEKELKRQLDALKKKPTSKKGQQQGKKLPQVVVKTKRKAV